MGYRTELRDHFVTMASWHEVEIQMSLWKEDGNDRHILVASVMAVVALESFLNNIIEYYQPCKFDNYLGVNGLKERIKYGVEVLGCKTPAFELSGWSDLCRLLSLRDQIVHRKTKSTITIKNDVVQRDEKPDWSRVEPKINSIKIWVLDLWEQLSWDSEQLEGQSARGGIKQRFDSFFAPSFLTTKEIEQFSLYGRL